MLRRALTIALVAALVTSACSDDDDGDAADAPATTTASTPTTAPTTPSTTEAPATTVPPRPAGWTLQPGWEQVAVLDAEPGTALSLVGEDGAVVAEGDVDELGSLLFRAVPAGPYTIRSTSETTAPFEVAPLDQLPAPSFYSEQRLPAGGYGYLQTRDGTTLSVNVVLPGPADAGPYPTVVEYSGYEPSNPDSATFAQIYTALGYAYVGVNVRGSGCSGGSFAFFEDAQLLDGYDAIETIAAQPWVLGNRVGMVGVSYPGISQLFVASTNPPSLAAITPLSVIDDSSLGVIYPGGILNTGFGVEWAAQRMAEAQPEGQGWTSDRIDAGGDEVCAANQRLRLQNADLVQQIDDNQFWTDEVAAPLAPRLFVDRIDVPVFLAGAWQDEQTGGRFATMLDRFSGTDRFYASLVNGLHTESIGPGVFPRYVEFLDLYVAQRTPSLDAAREVAPALSSVLFGTDQVTLPADRFTGQTYDQALATFEAEPPIQVLFEEGAADGALPGSAQPRWIESFDSWPVPATATAWYLGPDGTLTGEPATAMSDPPTSYTADPDALPPTFLPNDTEIWAYDVRWDWRQPPDGTAASFTSEPLGADTVVVGSGSADLWIRSDADDTDLEVTISEIRPDGQEVYVQSGWLRASQRALDEAASTELRPVQTHLETDAAPLAAGEWNPVRVELFPVAHVFRAGSRLRVTVDAPGGNRAEWIFESVSDGETVEIAHDAEHESRVVLPVVDGVTVPEEYPTCTLRGQPCRTAP